MITDINCTIRVYPVSHVGGTVDCKDDYGIGLTVIHRKMHEIDSANLGDDTIYLKFDEAKGTLYFVSLQVLKKALAEIET